MALVSCPECKRKVSDKAESCPKCGYIINKKVTTIELTGKKWKEKLVIGIVLIFFGIFLYAVPYIGPIIGTLSILVGVGFIWTAKLGEWWYHH